MGENRMDINRLSDRITLSMGDTASTVAAKQKSENKDVREMKSNAQCFRDLCKQYPDASFLVISDDIGTISDSYAALGACDTSQFGYPGKVSFLIPQKVIEKMARDPEYEKRACSQINSLIHNYNSIAADIMDSNMNSVAVQLKDLDETDRNHLGFTTVSSEGAMDYYINAGKKKYSFHQEVLKKFNYLNEIKYYEMIDQLLQKKNL